MKTLKQYMKKFGVLGFKLYMIKKMKFPRIIQVILPESKDTMILRPNTSDIDVFQQIFVNEEYELSFIDILKMDIEGAEKEVFSNKPDWLNKVGMVAIELHDKIKPGCTQSFYTSIAPFAKQEYRKGENLFIVTNNIQNS